MEILRPNVDFLRVRDKYFPEFIFLDSCVSRGATLAYILLFRRACKSGCCRASQLSLAKACKCSIRSIQTYLGQLEALQYIDMIPCGDRNIYRLLRSGRAQYYMRMTVALESCNDMDALFNQPPHEEDFSSARTQNLRVAHAKTAHAYKEKKSERHTPLSPLPATLPHEAVPSGPSSCREPFPAQPVQPRSGGNGRGDAFSPAEKRTGTAAVAADDDFERLWAVWPVKKDKAVSRRIFLSLSRARKLPALDALLATVARFKAGDRHWHNGCAPLLSSWLRGERWLDEPYAPSASAADIPAASPAPRPVPPLLPRPETPGEKARADAFRRAVSELQSLCPASPRNRIHAALCLARRRGLGVADVVRRVRTRLAGGDASAFELGDWVWQGAVA